MTRLGITIIYEVIVDCNSWDSVVIFIKKSQLLDADRKSDQKNINPSKRTKEILIINQRSIIPNMQNKTPKIMPCHKVHCKLCRY